MFLIKKFKGRVKDDKNRLVWMFYWWDYYVWIDILLNLLFCLCIWIWVLICFLSVFMCEMILMVLFLVCRFLRVLMVRLRLCLFSVLKFLLINNDLICVCWFVRLERFKVNVRLMRKDLLLLRVNMLCWFLVWKVFMIFSLRLVLFFLVM